MCVISLWLNFFFSSITSKQELHQLFSTEEVDFRFYASHMRPIYIYNVHMHVWGIYNFNEFPKTVTVLGAFFYALATFSTLLKKKCQKSQPKVEAKLLMVFQTEKTWVCSATPAVRVSQWWMVVCVAWWKSGKVWWCNTLWGRLLHTLFLCLLPLRPSMRLLFLSVVQLCLQTLTKQ